MTQRIPFLKFLTHRRLFVIVGLAVAGFLIYYFFFNPSKKAVVETATVMRGKVEENLTISGEIDAREKATLRFATAGQITWVGVKEGDTVTKYQPIASLDKRSLERSLAKYLNTYQKTRNDFDQTHDDNENKVIDDSLKRVLDDSQLDLNSSIADVEIQDLLIKLSTLWTPISGLVTKVPVTAPGTIISSPAQAEFEVVNPETVYFLASVDQTEVSKIAIGKEAALTLDAYPDDTLTTTITDISFSPKSDESGTVYAVKLALPQSTNNSNYRFRLGMTGDVTMNLTTKNNVLYLPPKFVKAGDGKKYVNLFKNGQIEKTFVTVGLETDTRTEILSGIAENTIVSK